MSRCYRCWLSGFFRFFLSLYRSNFGFRTGANPRYPLISELKQILLDTYYGREFVEGEAGAKAEVAPVKAEKKAKKSA